MPGWWADRQLIRRYSERYYALRSSGRLTNLTLAAVVTSLGLQLNLTSPREYDVWGNVPTSGGALQEIDKIIDFANQRLEVSEIILI